MKADKMIYFCLEECDVIPFLGEPVSDSGLLVPVVKPFLHIDPSKIDQVIRNLISNAVQNQISYQHISYSFIIYKVTDRSIYNTIQYLHSWYYHGNNFFDTENQSFSWSRWNSLQRMEKWRLRWRDAYWVGSKKRPTTKTYLMIF